MNTNFINESFDMILDISNDNTRKRIIGKNSILKNIEFSIPQREYNNFYLLGRNKPIKQKLPSEPVEIKLTFLCPQEDINGNSLLSMFFEDTINDKNINETKIRNKLVDDCSIGELLYAIKSKMNKNDTKRKYI